MHYIKVYCKYIVYYFNTKNLKWAEGAGLLPLFIPPILPVCVRLYYPDSFAAEPLGTRSYGPDTDSDLKWVRGSFWRCGCSGPHSLSGCLCGVQHR